MGLGCSIYVNNFGWRATLGIIIATSLYFVLFKEFKELEAKSADEAGELGGAKVVSAPVWVIIIHLLFLAWTVSPIILHCSLGFLTFIAFKLPTITKSDRNHRFLLFLLGWIGDAWRSSRLVD